LKGEMLAFFRMGPWSHLRSFRVFGLRFYLPTQGETLAIFPGGRWEP